MCAPVSAEQNPLCTLRSIMKSPTDMPKLPLNHPKRMTDSSKHGRAVVVAVEEVSVVVLATGSSEGIVAEENDTMVDPVVKGTVVVNAVEVSAEVIVEESIAAVAVEGTGVVIVIVKVVNVGAEAASEAVAEGEGAPIRMVSKAAGQVAAESTAIVDLGVDEVVMTVNTEVSNGESDAKNCFNSINV